MPLDDVGLKTDVSGGRHQLRTPLLSLEPRFSGGKVINEPVELSMFITQGEGRAAYVSAMDPQVGQVQ